MLPHWLARRRGRSWRPLLWVLLLAAGATALALLALREADRARRTANVLMKDYASFIADRFVRTAAETYLTAFGLRGFDSRSDRPSPIGTLKQVAQERDGGHRIPMPEPRWPEIRYLFAFDALSGELEIKGEPPPPAEREALLRSLRSFHTECGANQTLVLADLVRLETPPAVISGIAQTGPRGAPRALYGMRVHERRAVESYLRPLITPDSGCECFKQILPQGLSSTADATRVVSLRLLDAHGPSLGSVAFSPIGAALRRPLAPELPLSDWSVEVSLNPAAVQPLLPYGGRTPWTGLALLGALALASAAFAVRSLKRELELVRAREGFIANVSHELKTPLARIRLFNELLDRGPADDARRARYRQVIDRECRRLTFLVDNVLDFSRLEHGAWPPPLEPLDLRSVAQEALEAFRAASEDGLFTLETSLEPVPEVLGSPAALSQVVINLLDNAVKYSPEGSSVEVSLRANDGWVALQVADRGLGIPEAERERIFEDFYRIESGEAQRVAGAGLGLSLVRQTVAAHGGRVSVEGRPGGGSLFTVRLPRAGAGMAAGGG